MLVGKTAIGDALYVALHSLDSNRFDGVRRKIDLSGDGYANEGFRPERVRDFAVASGVTVNGLAIINDEPYLEEYSARMSSVAPAPSCWSRPTIPPSSRRSAASCCRN